MSMLSEFKEFAMKGNVVDLAVGVIIGGAFGKIVDSLVSDVIMPPIGKAMGGLNFADLFVNLSDDKMVKSVDAAKKAGLATINYGVFFNTIINFLIIAFVLFLIIKGMNRAKRAEAAAPAAPPAPSKTEELLTEMLTVMKQR